MSTRFFPPRLNIKLIHISLIKKGLSSYWKNASRISGLALFYIENSRKKTLGWYHQNRTTLNPQVKNYSMSRISKLFKKSISFGLSSFGQYLKTLLNCVFSRHFSPLYPFFFNKHLISHEFPSHFNTRYLWLNSESK